METSLGKRNLFVIFSDKEGVAAGDEGRIQTMKNQVSLGKTLKNHSKLYIREKHNLLCIQ